MLLSPMSIVLVHPQLLHLPALRTVANSPRSTVIAPHVRVRKREALLARFQSVAGSAGFPAGYRLDGLDKLDMVDGTDPILPLRLINALDGLRSRIRHDGTTNDKGNQSEECKS